MIFVSHLKIMLVHFSTSCLVLFVLTWYTFSNCRWSREYMDAYRCSVRRKCVCVSRISPLYERNTGYMLIIVIVQFMYLFLALKQNVAQGFGLISLYFNFLRVENPNKMNTRYIYLFTHLRFTLIRNCKKIFSSLL